jgi:hypothetical protein
MSQSVTYLNRHGAAWGPCSPTQSPVLATKIIVTDCCWHGSLCGCQHGCWCGCLHGWHVDAYVDDTRQPTWMTHGSLHKWWRGTYVDDDDVAPMLTMTWHLHGRWHVTYVDDDVTIIAALPAHKKSGPQFFQTISNYNSRTWSPIPM